MLLLDLSDSLRGLPDILTLCTDLLFLSDEDAFSLERRRLLEEELGLGEEQKPQWMTPPAIGGIREGRWFLEALPESHTGEYIRRQMAGAEYENADR